MMKGIEVWQGLQRRWAAYDAARRHQVFLYLLGLAGWILLAMNYPFDWVLPTYAEF